MIKKILTTILFIALFVQMQAEQKAVSIPANDGKLVRVGISNSNFQQYYFNTISVSATDDYRLIDKSTNSLIGDFSANEIVQIVIKDNLFDILASDKTLLATGLTGAVEVSSDRGYVTVADLKRAGKPAYYRGTLEITKAPNKNNQFNVINILDLQSYLKGVVPNEMPVRFGLEALKAQAVLARNYALKSNTSKYHNYDVCDSVACQVYYGANTEKPLSDRAVDETENIVAMYDGEMILALYSSTAGGYTENYENAFSTDYGNNKVFPGTINPYMRGVPDTKGTPELNTEEEFKKFYLSTPETFDNESPYFRWTKEWTMEELEDILKKTLKSQSSTGFVRPKFENNDELGKLKDIKVVKRGVSGKAMSVDIITDKRTYNVQKELVIRRVFQKNNIGLPSANVMFEFIDDTNEQTNETKTKIVAHGGGFGHGVGMSQFGAGEMARRGYSYGEIIQHYFKNTSIATFPVELSSQGQDIAVQTFFTTLPKASLVVENKFHFTKFTVVINAQELLIEASPSFFKPDKVDLSPYLKKGENKITMILPYADTNKKPLKLYVEIKESRNE